LLRKLVYLINRLRGYLRITIYRIFSYEFIVINFSNFFLQSFILVWISSFRIVSFPQLPSHFFCKQNVSIILDEKESFTGKGEVFPESGNLDKSFLILFKDALKRPQREKYSYRSSSWRVKVWKTSKLLE